MELAQRRIDFGFLPEVALYPQRQPARPQVRRHGVARAAELAGHGREEDAEVVLLHGAGVFRGKASISLH